ncbi:MAG: leucine-rich repeat domain-containing protein [Gammaproteobacteria bacterium]
MYSKFPFHPCLARLLRSLTVCGSTLLLLAACKNNHFVYTFNDNVINTPGEPGQQLANLLRDANLQGCLNQLVDAGKITDLAMVKLLACPGSGVHTLVGIDKLSGLEQLELSDNTISDLFPLADLKNLRTLGLRNNPLTSIAPLAEMQLLRFVSLQGNDRLPCKELAALKARLGNTLSEPLHCVE